MNRRECYTVYACENAEQAEYPLSPYDNRVSKRSEISFPAGRMGRDYGKRAKVDSYAIHFLYVIYFLIMEVYDH